MPTAAPTGSVENRRTELLAIGGLEDLEQGLPQVVGDAGGKMSPGLAWVRAAVMPLLSACCP